jgi:hypothetical protein
MYDAVDGRSLLCREGGRCAFGMTIGVGLGMSEDIENPVSSVILFTPWKVDEWPPVWVMGYAPCSTQSFPVSKP